MLLIDYSLILGTGYVLYNFLNWKDKINLGNIIKQINSPFNNWTALQKSLGMEGYKLKKIKKVDTGYSVIIELPLGGKLSSLEDKQEEIEKAYKCRCLLKDIRFSNLIQMEIVDKEIKGLKQPLIIVNQYQLLFGYDFKGEAIIANMLKTPHVGVIGTSNMGKSKCIEMSLKKINSMVDIALLNTFADEDFTSLDGVRINDYQEMRNYLKEQLDNKEKREKPLYILIDEYNVLSKSDKKGEKLKIDDLIQGLLEQARHFNVFLIVIMQLGNKDDCRFKNLFNCRLAFKTIESQTISAFIGSSISDTNLECQEFYLYHTELIRGRSYDMD